MLRFVKERKLTFGAHDYYCLREEKIIVEADHRILIVEDDVELSKTIVDQLEAAGGFTGMSVTTIQAAEQAVFAHAGNVSAILLDVSLPDGDGRDFCARLRQNGNNIPVVLVSGLDQENDIVRGLDLGADAYVRKPFAFSELIARLRWLLPNQADFSTQKGVAYI